MKKFIILALVASFIGCSGHPKISNEKKQQVVDHFKRDNIIKDSAWASASTFRVGVLDNGSNRDGLAQYVCQELNSLNVHNVAVKVIDIQKLVSIDKWVELGKANCS